MLNKSPIPVRNQSYLKLLLNLFCWCMRGDTKTQKLSLMQLLLHASVWTENLLTCLFVSFQMCKHAWSAVSSDYKYRHCSQVSRSDSVNTRGSSVSCEVRMQPSDRTESECTQFKQWPETIWKEVFPGYLRYLRVVLWVDAAIPRRSSSVWSGSLFSKPEKEVPQVLAGISARGKSSDSFSPIRLQCDFNQCWWS